MSKCRCINCLFYCGGYSDGKCNLKDKSIDYPYADSDCFAYADKENKERKHEN